MRDKKYKHMFEDGDFLNWLSDNACMPTCGNFTFDDDNTKTFTLDEAYDIYLKIDKDGKHT